MKYARSRRPVRDRVVLLLLFALFLFASPFASWWASSGLPWHFPFILWGILIAFVASNQIWGDRP